MTKRWRSSVRVHRPKTEVDAATVVQRARLQSAESGRRERPEAIVLLPRTSDIADPGILQHVL